MNVFLILIGAMRMQNVSTHLVLTYVGVSRGTQAMDLLVQLQPVPLQYALQNQCVFRKLHKLDVFAKLDLQEIQATV
jgi:hypothetical protein